MITYIELPIKNMSSNQEQQHTLNNQIKTKLIIQRITFRK